MLCWLTCALACLIQTRYFGISLRQVAPQFAVSGASFGKHSKDGLFKNGYGGFPKLGHLVGAPKNNEDYSCLGSMLRSPFGISVFVIGMLGDMCTANILDCRRLLQTSCG